MQRDWRFPFISFYLYGNFSDDPHEVEAIKRISTKFYYNAMTWTLYCQSHDEVLLRCLSPQEAQEVLKKPYDDTCGAHQLGPKLSEWLQ